MSEQPRVTVSGVADQPLTELAAEIMNAGHVQIEDGDRVLVTVYRGQDCGTASHGYNNEGFLDLMAADLATSLTGIMAAGGDPDRGSRHG